MRNAFGFLRLAATTILKLLMNPSHRNIEAIIKVLSVKVNHFPSKRKRPLISRYIRYTKDIFKGKGFDIGDYTYGKLTILPHTGRKFRIGKYYSIAVGVTILLGANHGTDLLTSCPFKAFIDDWPAAELLRWEDVSAVSKGDVIIGNDVWIGRGATILSGVTIGDGAIIGACAVVTANVAPYSIVVGNPARLIKKRFDDETIRKLLGIKWWDWPKEKIRHNMQVICSNNISKMF